MGRKRPAVVMLYRPFVQAVDASYYAFCHFNMAYKSSYINVVKYVRFLRKMYFIHTHCTI
jgi:hypothetical protein